MYESAYNKLFWGMIFIIFNFNIGPVNILPDFIGYILIYIGLDKLTSQHEIYKSGKIPAILLTLLNLGSLLNLGNINLLAEGINMTNLPILIISQIGMLINLYLIYIICKGIYLLAEERGLNELKESARGRFKAYLIMAIIIAFCNPFLLNLGQDFKSIMILLIIINIIISILIAGLFRGARKKLGEGESTS